MGGRERSEQGGEGLRRATRRACCCQRPRHRSDCTVSVGKTRRLARGELRVHRMVLALDCGHAVNPDQIAAQVEGSVAYGLSAALHGEITIDKGRVNELNFHTYPIHKLAEFPKVETVIVPTHDFWGGVGEPTICVVTPCVLNAIHAATGKPVRSLPLKHVKLV
ncbi:MAG TPA: molybdopterin cofactor-binding domain-containing protein [Burkholderiaceae bacterium]|nr:molybdopterin cofactor-binding domain-containing protein [Burkholderiaceae bacterium]